ncbi:MAG: hypothetical protein LBR67_01425 [Dysgonamonadaceae bacterium]|nr:hypothetical protein [Dysgonamonadaceae bacterium]
MNVNQHALPLDSVEQDSYFDSFLAENGYGGMATNVSWQDYLDNDEYLMSFCRGVRTAKKKGYNLWLYDEQFYPSGMAGEKVLSDHPEWEAEGLLIFTKKMEGDDTLSISMPGALVKAQVLPVLENRIRFEAEQDVSAFFNDGCLKWKAPKGEWLLVLVTRDVLYKGFQAGTQREGTIFRYPSLMMPEVTQSFINHTHKRYEKAFGEKLGNYFTANFTDEPSLMALPFVRLGYGVYPWKQNLSDEFRKRYGYELQDKLTKIALDDSPEGAQLRFQYFQLVSDMISKNYFQTLKDYCHSQNFLSGGHLLLEESIIAHVPLYGNIMACYRAMDIPGIDVLTAIPSKTKRYLFSSRLASSAAELQGGFRVMYESCPIENDPPDYTEPPALYVKGVHNRAMVGGITDFNNYLKLEHENNSGRNAFNEYTARVVSLLCGGVRASKIAVYYPIETAWTKFKPADMWLKSWWGVQGADPAVQELDELLHDVTYLLTDNGWEFSFLDAQGLVEAKVKGNLLCHGKDLKWEMLILPSVQTIPEKAFHKIVEFVRHGGKLVVLGNTPVNSEKEFPSPWIQKQFNDLVGEPGVSLVDEFHPEKLAGLLENRLQRDITFDRYEGIMHCHRKIDGKDVFFVINDSGDSKSVQIGLPKGRQWELWNPQTGEIEEIPPAFQWTFDHYDGIILRNKK